MRMHADEVPVDTPLVARLLADQFPQWAGLPLEPFQSCGSDNVMFRLDDDMVVRLPRIATSATSVDKEHHWLPRLAPRLPLAIPTPLGKGWPANGYPWSWSVYRWLDGEPATVERLADPALAAGELGRFVAALRTADTNGAPASYRGRPLSALDDAARSAIAELDGTIDTDAATAAWEEALDAPAWKGQPVWIHGDLIGGNLLAHHGQLSAVIDFGACGIGDPACDTMAAWTFLSAGVRGAFRAAVEVDDATWARGRGWALAFGLVALPYYRRTNPVLAARARRAIDQVLADQQTGTRRPRAV